MCYRLSNCLPLVLLLGGCAALEATLGYVGLIDATGKVTATGHALDGVMHGLMGFGWTRLYDAFGTKRGWDNLRNAFDRSTGLKGFVQSVVSAIILGWHTPEQAKKPTKS